MASLSIEFATLRNGLARKIAASRFGSGLVAGIGMLTVAFVLSISPSHAATAAYYVAPNGSDSNPGTLTSPFKTVSKGLTTVRPGGTVYIRGGTYAERIKGVPISAGTSTAPVTIRPYGDEKPILSGLLWLNNASYWRISGLTVTWSSSSTSSEHMVKLTGGDGWRFYGNTLSGARSYSALLIAGAASNWLVSRNTITNTYASNDVNQDHLIYVNGTGYGDIENNVLLDSPNGRAIKVMDTHDGLGIRYNTMERNTGPSNIQLTEEVNNLVVERNIMVRSAVNRPAVTTFAYLGKNNVVRDNLLWETKGVIQSSPGLIDGGGNMAVDPAGLTSTYGASAGAASPTASPVPTIDAEAKSHFIAASNVAGAAQTSIVIPAPDGLISGDLMLASLLVRGAPSITPPAGWTMVKSTSAGSTARLATFSHVATAAEPTTATFVLSASQPHAATVAAYRNATVTSSGATISATSTRSIVAPSVSTPAPATMLAISGVATVAAISPDARMIERSEVATPSLARYMSTLETADMAISRAGETGIRTATSSKEGQTLAHSIALVPASAG